MFNTFFFYSLFIIIKKSHELNKFKFWYDLWLKLIIMSVYQEGMLKSIEVLEGVLPLTKIS